MALNRQHAWGGTTCTQCLSLFLCSFRLVCTCTKLSAVPALKYATNTLSAHDFHRLQLLPSHFRLKGLPPEDAAWICGCGFCQPTRQQHSHGGWAIATFAFDQMHLSLLSSVSLPLTHSHTHTHTPHIHKYFNQSGNLASSLALYFSLPLTHFFFLSVSVGLVVSTESLTAPCSSEVGLSAPPWGKLVYFWVVLTRYNPYCVLCSFKTVVLPFPHIMSPFVTFACLQFLSQFSLVMWCGHHRYMGPCSILAAFIHCFAKRTRSLIGPTKLISKLSPLPPCFLSCKPADCGSICHTCHSQGIVKYLVKPSSYPPQIKSPHF